MTIHAVRPGEPVGGSDNLDWYRVAIYSGEEAWVWAGLCTDPQLRESGSTGAVGSGRRD